MRFRPRKRGSFVTCQSVCHIELECFRSQRIHFRLRDLAVNGITGPFSFMTGYLGVSYIMIFSQVHRGAQHAHIFSPVLVRYQLHLVWGRLGRRSPWHSGDVWRSGSAKLCPKPPYVPWSHTYLDCYRRRTRAFLDLPHCVTYGLGSQTFCHLFP